MTSHQEERLIEKQKKKFIEPSLSNQQPYYHNESSKEFSSSNLKIKSKSGMESLKVSLKQQPQPSQEQEASMSQKSYIHRSSNLINKKRNYHTKISKNDDQIGELNTRRGQDYQSMEKLSDENTKLQFRNKKLWEQLKILSKKVDTEINKRSNSESNVKKKNRTIGTEIFSNIELQNAYKQCEIYKKEIISLRKKEVWLNEHRMNQLEGSLAEYKEKNIQLLQQIKVLKNSINRYQKMMRQVRDGDYIKMKEQNQRLRKQNMALHKKQEKDERQFRLQKLQTSNEKKKRVNQSKMKEIQRLKAEQQEQKVEHSLKSKVEKSDKQIRFLNYEKNQQAQIIKELKSQILELNQDNIKLKEIIRRLRLLSNPKQKKRNYENEDSVLYTVKKGNKNYHHYPITLEYGETIDDPAVYKWNHLTYSSKVKEIQVMMHKKGHIQALNFRYEMGQPIKPLKDGKYAIFCCSQSEQYIKQLKGGFYKQYLAYVKVKTNKGREASFCRHQLDEADEIDEVDGEEDNNVLLEKNDEYGQEKDEKQSNRSIHEQSEKYFMENDKNYYAPQEEDTGNIHELRVSTERSQSNKKEKCHKFAFGEEQHEFIKGFYGESNNEGIVKLGCLVDIEKRH